VMNTVSYNVSNVLADNGHWFWRIRTFDDGGLFSEWSGVQDF